MSKGKALFFAAVALAIALLFLPSQLYGCFVPFLIIALFFGATASYKARRDKQAVEQIQQQTQGQQTYIAMPPIASKGSNRLFVPPPLK